MATLEKLVPIVRVYLGALASLDGVAQALAAADGATRAALPPPTDPRFAIEGAEMPAAPARFPGTDGLWRPADPQHLSGLTDLYTVVGRFTLQGDLDNDNLRALAACVDALDAEIARQRADLDALAAIPERLHARAARDEESELASSRAQQQELLAQFEPEAKRLREAATALADAVLAVKKPDLARLETAPDLYRAYITEVNDLYAKALPGLRERLAALSRVAECEVPPSWPDALPFAPALPEELVAAPPAEDATLSGAREAAAQHAAHETALARAQDELGVQLRRVEGEIASLTQREAEQLKEIGSARLVVRWAAQHDALDGLRAQIAAVVNDGQVRTQSVAQLGAEAQRLHAAIAARQAEATELAQSLPAQEAALEKLRGEEPALFGKDEWRKRLRDQEEALSLAQGELTRRQQEIVALQGEVARIQARQGAEQGHIAALSRTLEEHRAQEAQCLRELAEIEQSLGSARPPRRVSTPDAERSLEALQAARVEARARLDRLAAEARRVREDSDRAAVQLRQMVGERERVQGQLTVAQRQAAEARNEALQALAHRRQQGFVQHVGRVLSDLTESLRQVDRIFADPARRALLVRAGVMSNAPVRLRADADALAQQVAAVRAVREPELALHADNLARLRQDFVARAAEACRSAWDA